MATMRIDDDVNEVLKARAGGGSATKLGNQLLRQGLGMIPTPTKTVTRRRAPAAEVKPADCPHPPGRRLNGHCMACGGKVGT